MPAPTSVFEWADGVYDFLTGHPYWVEHARRLLAGVGPLPAAPRLLDLGCGPGRVTRLLAGALGPGSRVIGLDRSPRMLLRAAQLRREAGADDTGRLLFVHADAGRLPFADGRFDVVTGHSFLYLVPDPAAVLREARRVLAPGGWLALMEPSAHGSLGRAARAALPQRDLALRRPLAATRFALAMLTWRTYTLGVGRMGRGQLVRLLGAAGFESLTVEETLGGLGLLCRGRRGG